MGKGPWDIFVPAIFLYKWKRFPCGWLGPSLVGHRGNGGCGPVLWFSLAVLTPVPDVLGMNSEERGSVKWNLSEELTCLH